MKYLIVLLSICSFEIFGQKKQCDLIVKNAKIYTVNQRFEIKSAMAIKNGKFEMVADDKTITELYDAAEILNMEGKAVFPGFFDPHSHFLGYAEMLGQCDLVATKSFEEILEKLKQFKTEESWIIGRGWDQNDWAIKEFPDKKQLDILFPDTPVALTRIDGHALLANTKAMNLAKISVNTKIDGGDILRENGELTGIFIDNAMGFIKRVIPELSNESKEKLVMQAQKNCFEKGLTSVSEAGVSPEDIMFLMQLQENKTLKIRDYAMVSIGLRNIEYFAKKGKIKTDHMHVSSFKLYADGALGSRGAALLKPYADEPANKGLLLTSAKEMDKYYADIKKMGFQANTHCIGDAANRTVLNLYGKYLKTKNNARWRIEHCQVVSNDDISKFGKYSIIPSVQATHATSDMYWAEKRLGKDRVKTAYAFNALRKQNGIIANGSDFPVEDINPLYGFHAAVARQDAKNWPEGGYQFSNALSRNDALKAMTIWAAYANFEEKEKGSIEKGKLADFVVLEEDIMEIEFSKIRNTKVLRTYVGGEKVF